jgi:hypothetical protein
VIENRECGGWAAARALLDSTCLADIERLPGLLCTREVNDGRVANDEDILEDLGAENFLAALNDAATSEDIADKLGVTTCFSDSEATCENPDFIRYPPGCERQADVTCQPKGCEDCIKELRDCLSDRCGRECRTAFSPTGSLDFGQPECACCGLNETFGGGGDPRTCMKNFRWCSGITGKFFEDFASEPIGGQCVNF